VIFGSVRLPRIAPFNADLFFALRQAHSVLAYTLVVVIAAHVSAVLLHTLTLRDGMLSRMTFGLRRVGKRERARNVRDPRRVGVQTRTLAEKES
jgi:hypothetical protein